MRILYVWGDNDYAALEAGKYGYEKLEKDTEEAMADGYNCLEFYEGYYSQILNFDYVYDLIEWLKDNILDYDHSKHTNFWLLEKPKKQERKEN